MVVTELKYECSFCATPTNFKDKDNAYCIDCYVKLRNSAHTHETIDAPPIKITPQPLKPWSDGYEDIKPVKWPEYDTPYRFEPNPYRIGDIYPMPRVIC